MEWVISRTHTPEWKGNKVFSLISCSSAYLNQKPRWFKSFTVVWLALALAAASITPLVASPAPSFSLSASASSFSLLVGENAWNRPVAISVTNPIGLVNGVSLTSSGVPAGVTTAFATVNSNTTNLTFKASSTAIPGTYPITVTGTSGSARSSTTIALTIPVPGFSLSSSATSLTLLVGGASANSAINVAGTNGFTDNVALIASGLPTGVTATFSPAITSFNKSTLTLIPGSNAVPGTYIVTVNGTAGTLKSSTNISLTVPVPSFSVTSSASAVSLSMGGNSVASTIGVANLVGLSNNNVNLSLSGVPAGVTAGFNWPVTAPSSPVTLTFKAAATAAPGTYAVKVTGTTGTTTNAATIALTISGPSFSLSPSAGSYTLLVGQNAWNSPINVSVINPVGLLSNVSLAASGVPAGVTASFGTVSSTVSALTFKASTSVAPGTYPVTVTGTSGATTSATTIMLVIQAPSFSLSPSVGSLSLVVAGPGASSTVSVVGQNGFNGSVNLSVSGVPSGVTATFSSASTVTNSVLTFTPSNAAVPGTYVATVTGASGILSSATQIAVTVQKPGFSLSSSVGSLTLPVGGPSASSTISVVGQNGFNGSVNLSVSGLPSGVTAAFSAASTTTNSVLTFTPSSAAVPGTYVATVTGVSGTLSSAATIALTVPGSSFTVTSSPSTLSVFVGGSRTSTTIGIANPIGLSNANVNLTLSGVPAGVTASFNWAVAAPTSPVTLYVTAGATAVPGNYAVKVTGTTGTTTSATTITLTVTKPSFSLTPSAGSFTLQVGENAWNRPVAIAVTNPIGLPGGVSLTASGVPAAVTAAFATVDASTTNLTFKTSATTLPGTYPVTVTGTSGVATNSTTVMLTIQGAGFSLSSSVGSLTLPVGGTSASSTIGVVGQNGFTGSVNLSVTVVPNGITAAFSSASTTTNSVLTFTPSSAAVPGTYVATVTGTSGTLTSATTIALTVQAVNFSLSSSPNALTLVAGSASTNSTVGVIGVNGFNSNVTLAVSGVPSGVTAQFNSPIASPSSTSLLTFTASGAAISGTYSVTVTGTNGGVTSAVPVALTVQAVKTIPTAVAITQPGFGFNVLPGSVRRIFATVTGGTTNEVNWSVTGGARLSSTSGHWVDVTAPPAGSTCSINGTSNYTVSSATQFILMAQSQENPSLTASITVNVCNPTVQVHVVPFYTTLYSGQKADIQAFVWGSANRDVTWAVTAEPNGGDGVLADTANQDTVFSATTAGRYTLTATSVADGSRTNTATIYVTGRFMPYEVTPSQTMPVDCTVDPALTGSTYDVGPSQTYKTIQSVPWPTLTPGSTVRIHNEDTTGGSPTTYHEYFQLKTHATRTQPVRVCGVPDSRGNLPVIDASNATGRSDVSSYSAGYTPVGIGTTGWAGLYTGTWTGSQFLIVEGLKIQNAKPAYSYKTPSGTAGTAWIQGAACIRLLPSMDTVVRGIDAFNCSNGFFADFNANNGFAAVANTLYEGNHLHGNGDVGAFTEHQLYIQGWNEVAQFNLIDQYQSGAAGSNFKGRGFPEVVRYNHFGDGAARQLDMIDNQDAGAYTTFEGYLGGTTSYRAIYPADAYSADLLAAAVEAHHADYVYGNTFVNTTAGVPIHYSTDHGSLENDRIGTLWFYNNSFYEPTCSGCPNWRWELFDTSGGGGNNFPEIEWPQIQAHNNAIWLDSPTKPYFYWNNQTNQFTTFGSNVINSNWGSGAMTGGDGTGWASGTSTYAFQGASNAADTAGVSNLIGVSSDPFDVTTFAPNPALVNAGASLPASGPKLPVRFQYGPSAIQTVRIQPLTVGAME